MRDGSPVSGRLSKRGLGVYGGPPGLASAALETVGDHYTGLEGLKTA